MNFKQFIHLYKLIKNEILIKNKILLRMKNLIQL
jgi:hypothetical protein